MRMLSVLNTLLVGVTGRAKWAVDLAKPENGFRITSLCDINPEALESVRTKLELPETACFRDLDTALKNSSPDCLIICSPTRFHVEQAIQGIDAGLPVLTEKGMASTWEDAQRLVQYVGKKQGILCVAQNYRYTPVEQTLADCLAGRIEGSDPGFIYCADLLHHRVRPFPRTLDYPFASVWDMSCHHFDSLIALFGKPLAVTAQAFGAPWSSYSHPNNTSAHFEFVCGTRINYFHGHDAARCVYHFVLQGKSGAVSVDKNSLEFSPRPAKQFGSELSVRIEPSVQTPSEQAVLADFHRYIEQGVEPGISAGNNLETMAMCQMMVMSIEQNRRVLRDEFFQE
jgi:predicted dehydrogenase